MIAAGVFNADWLKLLAKDAISVGVLAIYPLSVYFSKPTLPDLQSCFFFRKRFFRKRLMSILV
jgi:hypothetical protein